jgi:hypothetical protein
MRKVVRVWQEQKAQLGRDSSAMQPIQVMQAIMTPEQFSGFLIGNIIICKAETLNKCADKFMRIIYKNK